MSKRVCFPTLLLLLGLTSVSSGRVQAGGGAYGLCKVHHLSVHTCCQPAAQTGRQHHASGFQSLCPYLATRSCCSQPACCLKQQRTAPPALVSPAAAPSAAAAGTVQHTLCHPCSTVPCTAAIWPAQFRLTPFPGALLPPTPTPAPTRAPADVNPAASTTGAAGTRLFSTSSSSSSSSRHLAGRQLQQSNFCPDGCDRSDPEACQPWATVGGLICVKCKNNLRPDPVTGLCSECAEKLKLAGCMCGVWCVVCGGDAHVASLRLPPPCPPKIHGVCRERGLGVEAGARAALHV